MALSLLWKTPRSLLELKCFADKPQKIWCVMQSSLRLIPSESASAGFGTDDERFQTLSKEDRARENDQRWRTAFENSAIGKPWLTSRVVSSLPTVPS